MNARPYARADAARAQQRRRARRSVDPPAARRRASRGPRAGRCVIVVTGDKGLCGSFNTNVIKARRRATSSTAPQPCTLGLVGRKGRDFFGRRGFDVLFEQVGIFQKLRFEDAQAIAQTAMDAFLVGRGRPRDARLQRVQVGDDAARRRRSAAADRAGRGRRAAGADGAPIGRAAIRAQIDYLYEPSPQEIFNQLLPRYVEVQVYRALLESNAAFFAAQMTAMDTATKNSADMIADLTLYMNKVRQAAITREIIEVVSGAEALLELALADEPIWLQQPSQAADRQDRPDHRPGRRRRVRGRAPARDLQRAPHPGDGQGRARRDRRHRRGRAAPRREPRARGRDEADRRHAARHGGDRPRRADLGAGRTGDARPRAERARRAGRLPGSPGAVEGALADSPRRRRRSRTSRPS